MEQTDKGQTGRVWGGLNKRSQRTYIHSPDNRVVKARGGVVGTGWVAKVGVRDICNSISSVKKQQLINVWLNG